jgi:hypothetical protein
MTHYFDRLCRVVIQGTKEIDIAENKISFEVTKSSNCKENVARIKIWNLSTETRKLITASNSLVRLFAGYADNKGLIEVTQGDLTNVRHSRNSTDTITEIYTHDGKKKLARKPITLSFKDEVTLKNILSKITEQSGFAFRLSGVNTGASVAGGYAAFGDLDLVLDGLALVFDVKWSVQDGIILIRGTEPLNDSSIMLLTPETGLILNPETLKQTPKNLADSDAPLPVNVYALQSLLQPHLQVNDLIAVESQDLNGNFRINKITHTGDTRGNDWYSNIEVIAA